MKLRRTITTIEGGRQSGVTTDLISRTLNAVCLGHAIVFSVPTDSHVKNVVKKIGAVLDAPNVPRPGVVYGEPSDEVMGQATMVVIDDADRQKFDVDAFIAKYPDVDFILGKSNDGNV